MKLAYTASARREVREITEFYARQDRRIAVLFIEELDRALALLLENPRLGYLVSPHFRRTSVRRFPYSVYYTLDELRERVVVGVVCHQRRRPAYWQDRVRECPGVYQVKVAA